MGRRSQFGSLFGIGMVAEAGFLGEARLLISRYLKIYVFIIYLT